MLYFFVKRLATSATNANPAVRVSRQPTHRTTCINTKLTHNDPDDGKRSGIRSDNLPTLLTCCRHAFDHLHETGSVLGQLAGARHQRWISSELLGQLVLEDGTADSDANTLAETAHKCVRRRRMRRIRRTRGRLCRVRKRAIETAEAETRNEIETDPGRDRGGGREHVEKAQAEGGDGPAGPDSPSEAAQICYSG